MPDVVDKQTRSRMMSGIQGKNTRPEIAVRQLLHRAGFRYRLHDKRLPGKPDIVLPKYRAVVLVNGCFWHGHGCHLFKWPSTRKEWWEAKIYRTIEKDKESLEALEALGWRIAMVWECALKGRTRLSPDTVSDSLVAWLRSDDEGMLVISGKTVADDGQ
jgi:DNA mismatch endonuclease (patch repair protein)